MRLPAKRWRGPTRDIREKRPEEGPEKGGGRGRRRHSRLCGQGSRVGVDGKGEREETAGTEPGIRRRFLPEGFSEGSRREERKASGGSRTGGPSPS